MRCCVDVFGAKRFHNMVLAAAMLHGTPKQKQVAGDQLNKLATADVQVPGKAITDRAADLATKLASTARKEVKGELVDKAKLQGPRHKETVTFVSTL